MKTASGRALAADRRVKAQAGAFSASIPEGNEVRAQTAEVAWRARYNTRCSLSLVLNFCVLSLAPFFCAKPDLAAGTLNALLTSAGLAEYLAAMEQRGCTRPEDLGRLSIADVQGMESRGPL